VPSCMRPLADAEPDPLRKDLFMQLSHAEESHAQLWVRIIHGIARLTLALEVVLCLGLFTAERVVGQVPNVAVAGTSAAAAPTSDTGESIQTGYDAAKGRALYNTNCSACHGANGEGQPGIFPPIKGSGVVTKDDATKHIHVVLNGLQGAKAGGVLYASPMPPFSSILNNVDIADIIDYERSSWGNHGKLVTAAQVAAERDHSK
jgi:cytochrome c oxidase cbb3-type subunit II